MAVKKRRKGMNTGFSLILLIFLVLILVTFASLSMISGKADERLSRKLAERTKKYYEVSNQANEIIGEMDRFLVRQYKTAMTRKEYYDALSDFSINNRDVTFRMDENQISWELPLQEEQVLKIELEILYPEQKDDTFYKITEWKTIQKGDWKKDDRISVFQEEKLPIEEKEMR